MLLDNLKAHNRHIGKQTSEYQFHEKLIYIGNENETI